MSEVRTEDQQMQGMTAGIEVTEYRPAGECSPQLRSALERMVREREAVAYERGFDEGRSGEMLAAVLWFLGGCVTTAVAIGAHLLIR